MFYTRYKLSQNVWTRKSIIALSVTMIIFGSLLGAGIIQAATAPQASPTTIGAPNIYGDNYYVGVTDVTNHLTGSLYESTTYVIYKSGTTYYAKNGNTEQILTSGADAAVVTQAAIDAVYALGGGKVILRELAFDISSLTIRPGVILEGQGSGNESGTPGATGWKAGTRINLSGTITIQDSAMLKGVLIYCSASYAGNAVTINGVDLISLSMKILDDVHFYCPTQTGTALFLNCVSTPTASAAIIFNTFGSITIQGFEYGTRILVDASAGASAVTNGNTFEYIGTWGTKYSVHLTQTSGDLGGNVFVQVKMQDATTAPNVIGLQVDGGGNHFLQVQAIDFLVPAVYILPTATRTVIQGGLIPHYIDLGVESIITVPKMWAPYNPDIFLPAPLGLSELYGADVIIPFNELGGVTANDLSRNGKAATLVHVPTPETQGQVFKITLDGANDYARVASTDLSGSRTYIAVVSPNFLETENIARTIFYAKVDANNYVYAQKTNNADGNRIFAAQASSGGGGLKTCGFSIGFAQNDIIVIMLTYSTSDNFLRLYANGVEIAKVGGATGVVGSAQIYLGSDSTPSTYWKGGIITPFAVLPRTMSATEIERVTMRLANLAGRNLILKNKDTATITAAATSVVVNHGCSYTPTATDVSIILTNLPTNDIGDVYVSTFTSTQFTITCRNIPGAATAIFAWTVRR